MLTVSYSTVGGAFHNWQVFQHGVLVGWVHASEDGSEFGGHIQVDKYDQYETWSRVQELCSDELAEIELLHSF